MGAKKRAARILTEKTTTVPNMIKLMMDLGYKIPRFTIFILNVLFYSLFFITFSFFSFLLPLFFILSISNVFFFNWLICCIHYFYFIVIFSVLYYRLVISVTGGAKGFDVSQELEGVLKVGLRKVRVMYLLPFSLCLLFYFLYLNFQNRINCIFIFQSLF